METIIVTRESKRRIGLLAKRNASQTVRAMPDVAVRLIADVSQSIGKASLLLGAAVPDNQSQQVVPVDRPAQLQATIWRFRQLLQEVTGGGGTDRDLMVVLSSLSLNSDRVERAFVAWVDLIEVLVQNSEQRYGSAPGRGALKADEVKEIVRYLLQTDRLDLNIPNVPKPLQPVIVDILVGTLVDAVVSLANRYGTWVDVTPSPKSFHARLVILASGVGRILAPITVPFAWLLGQIYYFFRVRVRLSTAVQSALDAIRRDSTLVDERQLVAGTLDTFVWIGNHHQQVIAAFELVSAVVQEAERFFEASGPEKKAYARDLIFAVLEDAGLKLQTGLMHAIVSALLDAAIDAAVRIFNKRGVFSHRSG
jgi:hypothetical protein